MKTFFGFFRRIAYWFDHTPQPLPPLKPELTERMRRRGLMWALLRNTQTGEVHWGPVCDFCGCEFGYHNETVPTGIVRCLWCGRERDTFHD